MAEQTPTQDRKSTDKDPLSPAGAAEHRSGRAYASDLISIPRRVLYAQAALILAVAVIFFMAGYVLAPGSGPKDEKPVVKKEKFGSDVVVPGKITHIADSGSPIVDSGAVVILLPKGSEIADRLSIASLRPSEDEPPDGSPVLEAIKYLGGAYLRTDEQGEFEITVRSGRYYVLVISKGAKRRENRTVKTQDVEDMEGFFAKPRELLGDQRYEWKLRKLGKDTLLNISLD